VKPNSKAAVAGRFGFARLDFLSYALNEPAPSAVRVLILKLIKSSAGQKYEFDILNNACRDLWNGAWTAHTGNSGKIDGVAKFQEMGNQSKIYTWHMNNSLALFYLSTNLLREFISQRVNRNY